MTTATTVAQVEQIVADAKAADAAVVAAERTKANAAIDTLTYLSTEEVAGYSTALADARTTATTAIDGMAYLSTAEKDDYKAKVASATDVAGVNVVVSDATDQNLANAQSWANDEITPVEDTNNVVTAATAQNLANAKTWGTGEVAGLTNLDDASKQSFTTQIQGATTTEQVEQIVTAAQTADHVERADYKSQVEAATSTDEIDGIVTTAQSANELAQAKLDANAAIDALTYLSDDEKAAYKQQVASATPTVTVPTTITPDGSTSPVEVKGAIASSDAINLDLFAGVASSTDVLVDLTTAKANANAQIDALTALTSALSQTLTKTLTDLLNTVKSISVLGVDISSITSPLIDGVLTPTITSLSSGTGNTVNKLVDAAVLGSFLTGLDTTIIKAAIGSEVIDNLNKTLDNLKNGAVTADYTVDPSEATVETLPDGSQYLSVDLDGGLGQPTNVDFTMDASGAADVSVLGDTSREVALQVPAGTDIEAAGPIQVHVEVIGGLGTVLDPVVDALELAKKMWVIAGISCLTLGGGVALDFPDISVDRNGVHLVQRTADAAIVDGQLFTNVETTSNATESLPVGTVAIAIFGTATGYVLKLSCIDLVEW
ncbi:GA module-containing protein [Weissella confusa]|uniref:GA module-containing protein n=1 Tax=Weissella confusa TaxID=1583 RepID=A0A923SMR1_WEICO|nr:GA module-containing protein [Weissella confusa]